MFFEKATSPAFLALAALVACRVRCVVGADGVSMRGAVRRRRIVPFASLLRVTRGALGLSIELRDGRTLVFAPEGRWRPATDTTALARYLDEVLARPRAPWRDGVSASPASAPFRTADIPNEVLVRIVEDPFASGEARVAAATALTAPSDEDRARVRAVAEACVSPELRAALIDERGGAERGVVGVTIAAASHKNR